MKSIAHASPRLTYKIKEAAELLGVSPITVRRAIERGVFCPIRTFRHPLIPASQLQDFIEKQLNGQVKPHLPSGSACDGPIRLPS